MMPNTRHEHLHDLKNCVTQEAKDEFWGSYFVGGYRIRQYPGLVISLPNLVVILTQLK